MHHKYMTSQNKTCQGETLYLIFTQQVDNSEQLKIVSIHSGPFNPVMNEEPSTFPDSDEPALQQVSMLLNSFIFTDVVDK